jgi:translation initiation factor IF-3
MPSRRRRFRYRPKPQIKRPPANEEIKVPEVRLIGSDGQQFGVVATSDALARAQSEGFDLVIVAEKAQPPVVRLLDLGKHVYEQRKKEAKQKAKSKGGEIKGVRIGFKTDEHDWQIRLRQAANFLLEGNKVKLEMRLKGREKYRLPLAEKKIQEFIGAIPGGAKAEDTIGRSHHGLSVVLTRATRLGTAVASPTVDGETSL